MEQVFSDASACQRRRLHAFALRRLTHARIADIASATGLGDSAVSHAVRNLEERARRQADLMRRLEKLRGLLS